MLLLVDIGVDSGIDVDIGVDVDTDIDVDVDVDAIVDVGVGANNNSEFSVFLQLQKVRKHVLFVSHGNLQTIQIDTSLLFTIMIRNITIMIRIQC